MADRIPDDALVVRGGRNLRADLRRGIQTHPSGVIGASVECTSMANPKIYADFHNADAQGRLRLNCIGTVEDLAKHHLELGDGLHLNLYSDDLDDKGRLDELVVEGVVSFSQEEHCWVATIDWSAIRNASKTMAPPLTEIGRFLPLSPQDSARTTG